MKKGKSKIKSFFKKRKKIFKPIFYTVGSIISFAVISLIITVISLGGFANFSERAKFEYLVWNAGPNICSNIMFPWGGGYGEYDKYFWKANIQFLDYYEFKPYPFVKKVNNLQKDETLFKFNHCLATRIILKAAHKDNQVAKEMLASYPSDLRGFYEINKKYLFQKYINSLNEKKLYNPALIATFADNFNLSLKKKRKLYKEAAEEGYLLAMDWYLHTFINEREREKKIDMSECSYIVKYYKNLSAQNSLLHSFDIVAASIGKFTYGSQNYFECSNIEIDFKKAILLMKEFNKKTLHSKSKHNFVTTYPALIYFNGWGNVEKNQDLAIELFNKNTENTYVNEITKAYLALIKFNEPSGKSHEEATKLLNEILKQDISNLSYLEKIDEVKSFIKNWTENWFKNPELVKTLNLYG